MVINSFPTFDSGTGRGIDVPQGVDNFDFQHCCGLADIGYFIGADNGSFGSLIIRRISNPATTTPTISGNIFLTVPATNLPILVNHEGNTGGPNGRLDSLDDRLMCAHIRDGQIWTVHNIGVDNTGVSGVNPSTRNGSRWYQINIIPASPTLTQAGTLFASSASNDTLQPSYWMPSIMTSGQGHMAIGCSTAGTNNFANAATAGRLSTDALGTIQAPTLYTASSTAYNPSFDPGSSSGRRWGDYSYTSLDPNDDMTLWTIQEYCNASNSWGVQVVKLIAPPPATPISISPSSVPRDMSSVRLTITGQSINGSGFFDTEIAVNDVNPGPSFQNRLNVLFPGSEGVYKKEICYISPTQVQVVISTVYASASTPQILIMNPDGQTVNATGLLTIT